MRNRNHRVEIYFTKNELETLTKRSVGPACPARELLPPCPERHGR